MTTYYVTVASIEWNSCRIIILPNILYNFDLVTISKDTNLIATKFGTLWCTLKNKQSPSNFDMPHTKSVHFEKEHGSFFLFIF